MASEVSICSNALLLLGAQTINSLAETSDRALIASNLWPQTRNSVLRSHPWNCCIQRVQLAPDETAPAFDWAYQFTLPSDYLKALSVGEAGCEVEFRIEGRKLLSDENPCLLRYVSRNLAVGSWDDMLVQAMTLTMAAEMAYAITQSSSLRDSMREKLEMHMRRARAVDGQEDTPETVGDSPLLQARMGSRSSAYRRGG